MNEEQIDNSVQIVALKQSIDSLATKVLQNTTKILENSLNLSKVAETIITVINGLEQAEDIDIMKWSLVANEFARIDKIIKHRQVKNDGDKESTL